MQGRTRVTPVSPKRILAVGAHPGDVEFFAGATLAGFCWESVSVRIVVCTDGKHGFEGASVLGERRIETRHAAEKLGISDVVFLGYPEGELSVSDALKRDLVEALRGHQPELVLAHDPTNLWRNLGDGVRLGHSDNRAAGQATLDAIHPRAEQVSYYPELSGRGLAPWLVREVWLFNTDHPDHFVDLAAFGPAKEEALGFHVTQSPRRLIEEAKAEAERIQHLAGCPSEGFRRLRLL